MKSTRLQLTLICLSILAAAATALAQNEEDPPKDRQPGAENRPPRRADIDESAGSRAEARRRTEARRAGSNLAQLTSLRQEIKTTLELTPEQEESIDRLFDEQLRAVSEYQHSESQNQLSDADLKELEAIQARMVEARKAGDTELVKKFRNELVEKARSIHRPAGPSNSQLFSKIAEHLNDQQREAFEELVGRLRRERLPERDDGPLRMLLKALRDPEMDLSADQRQKLSDLLRNAIAAHPAAEGSEEERRAKIAKSVREEVGNILTPEQNSKLEELLKKAEERRKADANAFAPEQPSLSGGEGKLPTTDDTR